MGKINQSATTEEILREVGDRLRRYRLQQNLLAARVATVAGVNQKTLERAENGGNATFETVVKILRALNRVDALDEFLPVPLVSPLALAELKGHERQRAGRQRRRKSNGQHGQR